MIKVLQWVSTVHDAVRRVLLLSFLIDTAPTSHGLNVIWVEMAGQTSREARQDGRLQASSDKNRRVIRVYSN